MQSSNWDGRGEGVSVEEGKTTLDPPLGGGGGGGGGGAIWGAELRRGGEGRESRVKRGEQGSI